MGKRWLAVMIMLTAIVGCHETSPPDNSTAASDAPYKPDALDNEMAATAEQAQNDIEAAMVRKQSPGDECFSIWDGSLPPLVDQVKDQLRDPDSFEHIQTDLGAITKTGRRPVTMRYRARNGFGGMEVDVAPAALDPRDCSVTLIASKRDLKRLLG